MLQKFTTRDLILIASLAGMGFVAKILISPLVKMISMPMMVPGGSLAGVVYMLWLVLAVLIVPKWGTGLLFGLLQALIAIVLGFKNQGLLTLVSYVLPGLVVDLARPFFKNPRNLLTHLVLTPLANMTGAGVVAILLFRHPLQAVLIVLGMALVSGLLGGFVSWGIYKPLDDYGVIK